jgi:hypothetical protein
VDFSILTYTPLTDVTSPYSRITLQTGPVLANEWRKGYTGAMAIKRANTHDRLCGSVTKDGSPCTARRVSGSRFCFFHDPDKASKRERARKAGGRKNRPLALPRTTPDVRLDNSEDLIRLVGQTINQVLRGQIHPRIANSVGFLINLRLRVQEPGDYEHRLAALEAAVKIQHGTSGYRFDEDVAVPEASRD